MSIAGPGGAGAAAVPVASRLMPAEPRMPRIGARLGALAALGALLSGCTSPGGDRADGAEAVTVVESNADAVGYKDLRSFVAQAPTVVVARVTAATDVVAEVRPSKGAEGVAGGDGPDLYGAVTFEVETVLRGEPVRELKVAFVSGVRDGSRSRIAYHYDYLTSVQRDDARLRTPAELAGTRFLLLAAPNTLYPLGPEYSMLAHPYGVGPIGADGTVRLGPQGLPPIGGGAASPAPVTLEDVKAAIA
jgi:hypothetical protein